MEELQKELCIHCLNFCASNYQIPAGQPKVFEQRNFFIYGTSINDKVILLYKPEIHICAVFCLLLFNRPSFVIAVGQTEWQKELEDQEFCSRYTM